jgi:hypothetical protein
MITRARMTFGRPRLLAVLRPLPGRTAPALGGGFLAQQLQKRLGCRCGILPRDQPSIDDRERLPVWNFLENCAEPLQLILDQEGHNVGELYRFLFTIGEASHPFPLHQRSALISDMTQHAGRMADESHRLTRLATNLCPQICAGVVRI